MQSCSDVSCSLYRAKSPQRNWLGKVGLKVAADLQRVGHAKARGPSRPTSSKLVGPFDSNIAYFFVLILFPLFM
jgi:hypothetical protein